MPTPKPCRECLRPCELHGHRDCATCHTHPGDCDFGGCCTPATKTIAIRRAGHPRVCEVRHACDRHAPRIVELDGKAWEHDIGPYVAA